MDNQQNPESISFAPSTSNETPDTEQVRNQNEERHTENQNETIKTSCQNCMLKTYTKHSIIPKNKIREEILAVVELQNNCFTLNILNAPREQIRKYKKKYQHQSPSEIKIC